MHHTINTTDLAARPPVFFASRLCPVTRVRWAAARELSMCVNMYTYTYTYV